MPIIIDYSEFLDYLMLGSGFYYDDVTRDEIERFIGQLNELKLVMEKQLEYILNLMVYDWMKNPFQKASTTCEEEILVITYDLVSKYSFDTGIYENL